MMVKVEDFPEWTPPIGGYQYRLRVSHRKSGYVIKAAAVDSSVGLEIVYDGDDYIDEPIWYASLQLPGVWEILEIKATSLGELVEKIYLFCDTIQNRYGRR